MESREPVLKAVGQRWDALQDQLEISGRVTVQYEQALAYAFRGDDREVVLAAVQKLGFALMASHCIFCQTVSHMERMKV
eukprot:4473829-Amphidinium_carterae.1